MIPLQINLATSTIAFEPLHDRLRIRVSDPFTHASAAIDIEDIKSLQAYLKNFVTGLENKLVVEKMPDLLMENS